MLTRLFLENWAALALLGTLVETALLLLWVSRRTARTARTVVTGLVLFGILLGVSRFVVTARERAVELCGRLAALADAGDTAGIGGLLSVDFRAADRNRDEFLRLVSSRLREFQIEAPALSNFEVALDSEGAATVVFDAVCLVRSADGDWGRIISRWRLRLRRSGRDWLVQEIEALPSPFSPIRDLESILR